MEKKVKAIVDKPVYKEYLNNIEIESEVNMDQVDAVKYIEKEYPETAKSFKEIQKEQYELFCRKQMDYGPKNISVGILVTGFISNCFCIFIAILLSPFYII